MDKETRNNITFLDEWKEKHLKFLKKTKNTLIRSVLISLLIFMKHFKKGLNEDLTRIKDGSYKNSFFLTSVFLCLFSWWTIYSSTYLEAKVNLSFSVIGDFFIFTFMVLLLDILLNAFKKFAFFLRTAVVIYLSGYLLSMTVSHVNEFRKSLQNNHKENITKQRVNEL